MPSVGWNIINGILRLTSGLVIPNNTYIMARNAANTADLNIIKINASNELDIGTQPANFGTMTGSSMTLTGAILAGAAALIGWSGRSRLTAPADGILQIDNNAATIGSKLKVDALPTVASGFGTSPAIIAGSTPFAGAVNVGTGGVATSGVINFNGTSFSTAPFVVAMNTTTGALLRATTTATQLTITANAAFTASDIVHWIAVGPRT